MAAPDKPGWSYSVGVWHSLRRPELCVFGLPTETATNLLRIAGDRLRRGAELPTGERIGDLLPELEVAVRPVRPDWYLPFFGATLSFYDDPLPPMLQLCWPDEQRRFAWEPAAGTALRDSQPMLWLRRDEHPPGVWAS